MKNNTKSLYIHIPFCKNICSYCDFCKMYYNEDLVDKYLESLNEELVNTYKGEELNTIYIGGGTPSSLSIKQLEKLFNILEKVKTSNNLEFTFEANINDISIDLLEILAKNKVNRISIGIETVNPKYLKLIERNHTKEEVKEKISLVKKYFSNINVDFMYGFNNQTIDELKSDLDFFKELDVPHISIYSLILEPNTKLFINNMTPLDEEIEFNMYFYIINYLNALGYNHYEVSNFSKPNYQSRHNLVYWNNKHYYGIGLGASGYIDNIRYTNTRSINKYLLGNYILDKTIIDDEINMENEMMLGLRKIEGVNKSNFFKKFGTSIEEVFDIDALIKDKLLVDKDGYLFIPIEKMYLQNSILVNFIKSN